MLRKLIISMLMVVVCCAVTVFIVCKKSENANRSGEEIMEKERIMNGLNDLNDLYRIKWIGVGYEAVGSLEVNTNPSYIKEGAGSLEFTVEKGDWSELHFKTVNTDIPDMDVTNLKNFSVWIYNAGDKEVAATLNVMKSGDEHLLSTEFILAAGEWSYCVMDINAVVTKYSGNNITGFSVQFKNEGAAKFYLDEFKAEFGKVFTEDDERYIADIDKTIKAISNLPAEIKISDEALVSSVFDDYNGLPDLYKSAVNNYDRLSIAMSSVLNAKSTDDSALPGSENERKIVYFDKFYGMTQIAPAYSSKISFGYSKNVRYGEEEGSTYISFTNEVWNYADISSAVMLENYDYVSFALYNDGKEKAFWLNNEKGWNNRRQLKTWEWQEIVVPVSSFNKSGVQFVITTSENGGTASPADGRVYVSAIRCYKLGDREMYKVAFDNASPYNVVGGAITVKNDETVITAGNNGIVSIHPNKEVKTISVAQIAMLTVFAEEETEIVFSGEEDKIIDSFALEKGYNTVLLSSDKYNETVNMRFASENGKTYKISNVYIARDCDETGMRLVLGKRFLPESFSEWNVVDLPVAMAYVKLYADADPMKLQSQFVKVTKETEENLYSEQEELFRRTVELVNEYAERVRELMMKFIDEMTTEKQNFSRSVLFRSVFEAYKSCKMYKPLDGDYVKKAETILDSINESYSVLCDMADAGKFYVNNDSYGNGDYTVLGNGYDARYGNYLSAYVTNAKHDQLAIKYDAATAGMLGGLDENEELFFYVYNGYGEDKGLFADFGGKTETNYKTLKAKSWTKVTVSVKDFKNGTQFGVSWVAGYTAKFKFSSVYVKKESGVADGFVKDCYDWVNE